MINIEDSLKELILSRYKSLREFTLKIEMPYSTLDTILKRGVDKANIVNILKICDELNISADKLANGIIEKKNFDINSLSAKEEKLLSNFNKLNDLGKNEAIKRVEELAEINKYIEENKEHLIPFAAHNDDLTPDESGVALERAKKAFKNMAEE